MYPVYDLACNILLKHDLLLLLLVREGKRWKSDQVIFSPRRVKPCVSNMEVENQTRVTRFILVGFPGNWGVRATVFLMLLVAYIPTVAENVIIILLVQQNLPLHKPVYFFVASLSLETWCISVTVPRLLFSFWSMSNSVSFTHCMIQLYFFIALMCTERVLLAAVACDRDVAICRPLHYPTIMSHGLCFLPPLGSCTNGFGISLAKIYFISCLNFCGPNIVNHVFCAICPVLNLSCTDMSTAELGDFVLALVIFLSPPLSLSCPVDAFWPPSYACPQESRRRFLLVPSTSWWAPSSLQLLSSCMSGPEPFVPSAWTKLFPSSMPLLALLLTLSFIV